MRRSTFVYFLLFLAALGAYYIISNREEPADIEITLEPEEVILYLFNASDGIPTGIRIESEAGGIVEVARNATNAWVLKLPLEASADQGLSEAAASQVTTMRILDTLPDVNLEVVGLNVPEYTLTIQFSDVERIVQIGVITPTGSGYYVLAPNGDVVIVSVSAVDAVLNLLTNPPYLETPTPSATPSQTPTATETFTPLPPSTETGTGTPATATPQP